MCGIAGICACDIDIDDDILYLRSAAGDEGQTGSKALVGVDVAFYDEVADGGIAHHFEESHAVVGSIVVDRHGVLVAIEDAFEGKRCVLVGGISVSTNHDIHAGVAAEVDVARQTGVHFRMAVIDEGCKPVELIGRADFIEAIVRREVVDINIAAVGADTIVEGVRVAVRLVAVREGQVAAFRRSVAIEVAHGVDRTVGREGNGMHINTQLLEPYDIIRLVTVDLVAHGTTAQVVLVFADQRSLIAIGVEVVRTLAVAVTPERVAAIHTDDPTGIVAVLDDAARVANPSAESSTLTASADTTRIEAVDHADAARAAHTHTADTSGILFSGSHGSLVAAVLEGDRAAIFGSAGDTAHEAQSDNRAEIVDDDILDVSTIGQDAEQAHILLFGKVDD